MKIDMATIIMDGDKRRPVAILTSDISKPIINIEGKPIYEYEIECLRNQSFTDIIHYGKPS